MQQAIYISDRAVAQRYGVSRPTIWRWIKTLNFPPPLKISPGCTRWKLSDIELWEVDKEVEKNG